MTTKTVEEGYWLSKIPSKRWAEKFFLYYSPVWITVFSLIVATGAYKSFYDVEFFILGLVVSLPCVIYPLLFPCAADKGKPILERYWVKANIWIALFGFVGNYFWTHYFFVLLQATYRFPVEFKLNEVPVMLYFVTHAYFISYHAATTPILRRYWTAFGGRDNRTFLKTLGSILIVCAMAYFTAFMEAWTISSVPYYHIEDRTKMYTIGSTFYMLYFVISFPMFARIDETGPKHNEKWNISRTALEGLGSAMIVFILCDFWRLAIGSLNGESVGQVFLGKNGL
ncbi:hypothetical protein ACTFIU_010634 [Dictyostelium citrinum]